MVGARAFQGDPEHDVAGVCSGWGRETVKLQVAQVASYLTRQLEAPVQVLQLRRLGANTPTPLPSALLHPDGNQPHAADADALKTFGYGDPILVECLVDGRYKRFILRTMATNQFDHQLRSDRAAETLLCYDTFNALPQHSQALDIGVVTKDHRLVSIAEGDELFLLTEYVSGAPYARDLQRLRKTGEVTGADLMRARQLAHYLAQIHSVRGDDPGLYIRRIRETFGSGEGIMGLIDSYTDTPAKPLLSDNGNGTKEHPRRLPIHLHWFEELEQLCVDWRWRLKPKTHRLTQVHGDFHPFNVLFERDSTIHVLNRSRGAWGEPADDVACMAINYLFFSLQRHGTLASPFEQLWNIFWNSYMGLHNDPELLVVIAPFLAWRALVLASPIWYNVADVVRYTMLGFARVVLQDELFDPAQVGFYLARAAEENPQRYRFADAAMELPI
jgi:hypothetical protein